MCHVFVFAAHPWVREDGNALEIPIDISVLHNLRQFVKFSRFKQFALRVKYNKHIYDRQSLAESINPWHRHLEQVTYLDLHRHLQVHLVNRN